MRSLVITTPAPDRSLLTIDEMRSAAGVTNGSRDAELRALEGRVAASIMSECNIAIGSGAEPTLRSETVTETVYSPYGSILTLGRRHNVVLSSATLDSSVVSPSDYVVDAEKGLLSKLQSGYSCHWIGQVAVVVYTAGFSTVPGDLKQAALDYFRSALAESGRDPLLKAISEDVPGLMSERREFWVGSIPGQSKEGAVPDIVAGQLKRFRNYVIG